MASIFYSPALGDYKDGKCGCYNLAGYYPQEQG